MKIIFNNEELKVNFFYPRGKTRSRTECTVLAGAPFTKDEETSVVGTSRIRRHSEDSPNLVVARTVALANALNQAGYDFNEALEIFKKLTLRYSPEYLSEVFARSA